MKGFNDLIKKKTAEEYMRGKITLAEAARKANVTLWEMEQFLVEQGFKSKYSLEDLKKELKELESKAAASQAI